MIHWWCLPQYYTKSDITCCQKHQLKRKFYIQNHLLNVQIYVLYFFAFAVADKIVFKWSLFVDNIFISTLAPLNFLASGFIFCSRALLHIIPQVPQVKTVEDFSATTFFLFSALFFDFLRVSTMHSGLIFLGQFFLTFIFRVCQTMLHF